MLMWNYEIKSFLGFEFVWDSDKWNVEMSVVRRRDLATSSDCQASCLPNVPAVRTPGRTLDTRDLQARWRKRDIHRHRPSRLISAITYRRIMSGPPG